MTLGSTATRKLDMIMRVQVGRWNLRSLSSIRLDGHTLPCMLVCISRCKDTACTTGGAATLLQLLQTSSSSSPAVQPPCRFTQPCQPKAMFGKSQGGYTGSSVLLFCSVRSVGRRLKFSEPRMLSCWIGCVERLEMIVGGSGHHGTR